MIASAVFSLLMDYSPHARRVIPAYVHGALQAQIVLSLAVLCLVAGAWQVRRGLTRIDDLHVQLGRLRKGEGTRLDGTFPAEVQPLVDDLNSLLDHRDQAVSRAIAKAGDLAHGLKTPLAVLTREAESAERAGQHTLAVSIRQQIDRMRRQVDYHLAHARAAASGAATGARSSVRGAADGLARVMQHVHADRAVAVVVECSDGHEVRVQREDLDEMLGNLLDNACKWARAQVVVRSASDGGRIAITVDDDGPGIAEELRSAVLQRGVRADEATPGTGLGLAIVGDLAEVYGGSIALEPSPRGGCRAVLRLPA